MQALSLPLYECAFYVVDSTDYIGKKTICKGVFPNVREYFQVIVRKHCGLALAIDAGIRIIHLT
ncbi:hypothetical protein BACI349Y_450034 [Bacillus sp. 349Y]|nr:hypothetical protein BACI349Y_450034 [Bacillus sp. 349Y]